MATKVELEDQIKHLQAEVAELKEQLAARDAVMFQSKEEGWLISTPNPRYSGFTAGVEFRNGRAFVPSGKPGAKRLVDKLKHDFGYRVTELTAADYQAMQLDEGEQEPEKKNMLEQVAMPGVIGGG